MLSSVRSGHSTSSSMLHHCRSASACHHVAAKWTNRWSRESSGESSCRSRHRSQHCGVPLPVLPRIFPELRKHGWPGLDDDQPGGVNQFEQIGRPVSLVGADIDNAMKVFPVLRREQAEPGDLSENTSRSLRQRSETETAVPVRVTSAGSASFPRPRKARDISGACARPSYHAIRRVWRRITSRISHPRRENELFVLLRRRSAGPRRSGARWRRYRRDLAEIGTSVVDHNHRAVRRVTDGLVRFASLLHEIQFQFVAGRGTRAQGAGEIG